MAPVFCNNDGTCPEGYALSTNHMPDGSNGRCLCCIADFVMDGHYYYSGVGAMNKCCPGLYDTNQGGLICRSDCKESYENALGTMICTSW